MFRLPWGTSLSHAPFDSPVGSQENHYYYNYNYNYNDYDYDDDDYYYYYSRVGE